MGTWAVGVLVLREACACKGRESVLVPLRVVAVWSPQEGREVEAENYLRRKCEGAIREVVVVEKEDLDLVRGRWGRVGGGGRWGGGV